MSEASSCSLSVLIGRRRLKAMHDQLHMMVLHPNRVLRIIVIDYSSMVVGHIELGRTSLIVRVVPVVSLITGTSKPLSVSINFSKTPNSGIAVFGSLLSHNSSESVAIVNSRN